MAELARMSQNTIRKEIFREMNLQITQVREEYVKTVQNSGKIENNVLRVMERHQGLRVKNIILDYKQRIQGLARILFVDSNGRYVNMSGRETGRGRMRGRGRSNSRARRGRNFGRRNRKRPNFMKRRFGRRFGKRRPRRYTKYNSNRA